jgi:hypothetical protein
MRINIEMIVYWTHFNDNEIRATECIERIIDNNSMINLNLKLKLPHKVLTSSGAPIFVNIGFLP